MTGSTASLRASTNRCTSKPPRSASSSTAASAATSLGGPCSGPSSDSAWKRALPTRMAIRRAIRASRLRAPGGGERRRDRIDTEVLRVDIDRRSVGLLQDDLQTLFAQEIGLEHLGDGFGGL